MAEADRLYGTLSDDAIAVSDIVLLHPEIHSQILKHLEVNTGSYVETGIKIIHTDRTYKVERSFYPISFYRTYE